MNPESPLGPQASSPGEAYPSAFRAGKPAPSWPRSLLQLCFILFSLEVGLFLVIFPWTTNWEINSFQWLVPGVEDIWGEPSFKGALTGLGLVNLYIATLQIAHMFRRR